MSISKSILQWAVVAALAATSINQASAADNLIQNGNAEAGLGGTSQPVAVPGWTNLTGGFTVIRYDAGGGYPNATDPGAPDRGLNYFSGGSSSAYSSAYQITDILAAASNVAFSASGYFGGFSSQADNARLTISFLDASSLVLGTAVLGPATPGERANATSFIFKEVSGYTPVGTSQISFLLEMQRLEGTANDGYADSLVFSLAPVPEADTYAMLLAGLGVLGAVAQRRQGRRRTIS